jgi:uncharacterized phage-associated protein/DNA-binding transcriptional regulator YiaG
MTNRSPYTGKPMELKKEKVTLNFRKEPFEIVHHSYLCADSGEVFEDDELSGINLRQVIDQYREKHNIPFPEQIKSIREGYGLSAAKMSDILGLGTNSWRLYENGEVPTIANARLIQLISDPANFLKHVTEFGTCEAKEIEKIKHHIDALIRKSGKINGREELFWVPMPNRVTGYSVFNKQKVEQMVSFFSEKMSPYKTALNKLLFYADFLHFKQTGRSITGLRYAAIDFGPVPDHYSSLYEMMTDEGIVAISGIMTEFGYTERFMLGDDRNTDLSVFSEKEISTLEKVYEQLKGKTTAEIVELSHQEEAWLQYNLTQSLIPYQSAYYIKAVG